VVYFVVGIKYENVTMWDTYTSVGKFTVLLLVQIFTAGLVNSYTGNKKKYGSVQNAMTVWKDYMVSMGFGYKLGIDLPGEKRGLIPNAQFYDKAYKGSWNGLTVISISIGQKMKSVSCSGTNFSLVWVPFRNPFPCKPPEPMAISL
jgi:hypothetical protein